jgi:hypothetical protein
VVFIEECSKRRVSIYMYIYIISLSKYISMAYYNMFLWISERDTWQGNGKRFS